MKPRPWSLSSRRVLVSWEGGLEMEKGRAGSRAGRERGRARDEARRVGRRGMVWRLGIVVLWVFRLDISF
jgi:hypothetical protein